jgi:hypothetical protein
MSLQLQDAPFGLQVHAPFVHWPIAGKPKVVKLQLVPLVTLVQLCPLHVWQVGQGPVQVPVQPSLAPPHLPVQSGVQLWHWLLALQKSVALGQQPLAEQLTPEAQMQMPLGHVWPATSQILHAWPPLPQASVVVPPLQVWLTGSQQPDRQQAVPQPGPHS